ncbi:MAG TPA: beta-ketoacyl-ACP synthase II [Spirochaetia bacterium]|nr:beta-ketoacyl-ACP synthase II [Spirochaetia bacterium]
MKKRVVVTGMGAVSPLGVGVELMWQRLMEGTSGVRGIDRFPAAELASRVAGLVPYGSGPGELDMEKGFAPRETKRNDPFILYARKAAEEALADAGYAPTDQLEKERVGVMIGSGIGGFSTLAQGAVDFSDRGEPGISAYFITAQLANLSSGQVAVTHGFGGPNFAVMSACATGAEAIASGVRAILLDEADVVVAGGSDAAVHPLTIVGFAKIHALSTHFNDCPSRASRPFDSARDGFVLAEGGGVLILEEYEHARARGARIHAELTGYASVSDAFHITATHPEGLGEQRALRLCLERAGLAPNDVDYLNAHATGTQIGDAGELHAIQSVFGRNARLAISSTKGAMGHTFGAAGAIEAIIAILSITHQSCPPTANLDEPESEFAVLNLVRGKPEQRPVRVAVSNSFGFGSTKVALAFSRGS